jgi:hypothetical protein
MFSVVVIAILCLPVFLRAHRPGLERIASERAFNLRWRNHFACELLAHLVEAVKV